MNNKKDGRNAVLFNFSIPPDLLEKVKVLAQKRNTTVSAIIKDYLTEYIGRESDIDDLRKRIEKLEKEVFGK